MSEHNHEQVTEPVDYVVEVDTRRKVYRAGSDAAPGRYYFLDDRKIVPRQVIKGVTNPDFDLTKYLVVPKPAPKSASTRAPPVDYSKIRAEAPSISKRIHIEDINMIATKQGWKLSARALKAMQVWGKTITELSDLLAQYKEEYSDCNYLDYNLERNEFITKWRSVSAPATPSEPDSE
jgi:hypothetical protein